MQTRYRSVKNEAQSNSQDSTENAAEKTQLKLAFKPTKPIESEQVVKVSKASKKQLVATAVDKNRQRKSNKKGHVKQQPVRRKQVGKKTSKYSHARNGKAEEDGEEEEEEESELIFEPDTGNYEDGEFEDEDDGSNLEPLVNNPNAFLKRQCFVCKRKMHQDRLNDHCIKHYHESARCNDCDKFSTNPSNYVTHLLSHLRKCKLDSLLLKSALNTK